MIKEIVFIVFSLALPVAARAWPGTVLSVSDGDTLTVAPCGDASSPVVVRLYGVDAPEADQPGGDEAAAFLAGLLPVGKAVVMVPFDTDKFGRTVALVMSQGACVNHTLIGAGLAWVDPRHCRARKLCRGWEKRQNEARKAGLGLWAAPDPTPPWQWRKQPR